MLDEKKVGIDVRGELRCRGEGKDQEDRTWFGREDLPSKLCQERQVLERRVHQGIGTVVIGSYEE